MLRLVRNKIFPTQVRTSQKGEELQNVYNSLKFFTVTAKVFGLFPHQGALNERQDQFKWMSWPVLYSAFYIGALIVAVGYCLFDWILRGTSIDSIADCVGYAGSALLVILHLKLAGSWPKLMTSWCAVDGTMNPTYGYPKQLDSKIRLFFVLIVVFSIINHLLRIGNRYEHVKYISDGNFTAEMFFSTFFTEFFRYAPVNLFTGLYVGILGSAMTKALNDLFIIIMSTCLALRFKQISNRLSEENLRETTISFWKEIREDYNTLVNLCKELDSNISQLILLSYFLNIFYLLIHLYHSLEPISLVMAKTYLIFSFFSLIFKTTSVCLYAAWINDESKAPTTILNSIDSSLYNVEIRRLLTQISFDKTALTGCKLFTITRGLILSVASAIVTYELVLIQFSSANLYDSA